MPRPATRSSGSRTATTTRLHAGVDEGGGAGRGPPVVGAGLERDVGRRPPGPGAGFRQGVDLGVRLAGPVVETPPDDLARRRRR